MWSADPRQMWSFPARFLATFFHNHGMLSLTDRPTLAHGHRRLGRYVEALTAPFTRAHAAAHPGRAHRALRDHVLVTPRGGEPERFDEVVLATHADQSLSMLADASEREHEVLAAIPYQANEAVLHTDRALLPRRRAAWSSWNYHLLDDPDGMSTVTYHMNTLQRLTSRHELCVTLNRTAAIDPAKVIATIPYAHPVFTAAGWRAQARHARDLRRQPHPLLRRLLALGLPRGRRRQRPARRGAPGMTASCVYEGTIRHRRHEPVQHELRYPIALLFVDLDELPEVLDGHPLWSARRPALGWLRLERLHEPPPRSATSPAPPAPCACSRTRARSATASTPSASTTATRAIASRRSSPR